MRTKKKKTKKTVKAVEELKEVFAEEVEDDREMGSEAYAPGIPVNSEKESER